MDYKSLSVEELVEQLNQRDKLIQTLTLGIEAVEDLIDSSGGVSGLHQNGDLAEWPTLRTGGNFESWLEDFDSALSAISAN